MISPKRQKPHLCKLKLICLTFDQSEAFKKAKKKKKKIILKKVR